MGILVFYLNSAGSWNLISNVTRLINIVFRRWASENGMLISVSFGLQDEKIRCVLLSVGL